MTEVAALLALAATGCSDDDTEILGTQGDGVDVRSLDCAGEACACSNGVDDDGDGRVDSEDPQCVAPFDDDEASWATGIPGDNNGSNASSECFFDGNSGAGNDPGCPTPNGCDCRGCCDIDLDGDGTRERVLLQDTCDYAPAGGARGEDGGACRSDGTCAAGLSCLGGFCSPCEACEFSTEAGCAPNPCDLGEVCVGDDPSAECPDGTPCLHHQECERALGEDFWCQTGCCVEIIF
jgi:hypothetical protein